MTASIDGARRLKLRVGPLAFTAWEMGHGPLVLLLHGFPDSPATFARQMPALAAAGWRAVAVTCRGYEASSQPSDNAFHLVDLAHDVVGWIDALGADRAHLVGHDWGATIGFAAAALRPERVGRLAVLAVPTPRRFGELLMADPAQLQRSSYILDFQAVGAAEQRVAAEDFAYLEDLWRRWSPGWTPDAASLDTMKAVFRTPGVLAATLTYYRQALDTTSPAAQAGAALLGAPTPVPTLGVYGAEDACIGADVFERAMQPADFPAGLRLHRIDGAGHFLHQERPDAVNRALIDFLRAPDIG